MHCFKQFGINGALCCFPEDELLISFETCRADKKFWNKIDYKELCVSLVVSLLLICLKTV